VLVKRGHAKLRSRVSHTVSSEKQSSRAIKPALIGKPLVTNPTVADKEKQRYSTDHGPRQLNHFGIQWGEPKVSPNRFQSTKTTTGSVAIVAKID
jgi:hypothetical protein